MSKKIASSPSQSPWSEMPPEILQKIGESTGSLPYQLQFRAVCQSWRSSFFLPQNRGTEKFPLEIPTHPSLQSDTLDLKISKASAYIVPTTSYVIQPTKGPFKGSPMLITADEFNPGFLSLRYPLSASHYRRPSFGDRAKCVDLLETKVTFIDRGFSVRPLGVRRYASEKDDGREFELSHKSLEKAWKCVVLSNSCCEDDLLVLVLCYGGILLAFRVRDGHWKDVLNGGVSQFADIVMFKEQVYGIDCVGRAFFIDHDFGGGDLKVVSVGPTVEDSEGRGMRLVVDSSSGRLYLVVRKTGRSDFTFLVYKLNESLGAWDKVRSTGNRMFFIGANFSFCARSQDFPGLSMSCLNSHPRNCIFFSKGSFQSCRFEDHGDRHLFGNNVDGTGMNVGQYCLGSKCATGLIEAAYQIMFSLPI